MLELLTPAGNLKKLKCALHFGADAVYIGGKDFSLRAYADNFGDEDICEGIAYAHERGKKVYVAVNIFAHDADIAPAADFFRFLQAVHTDAAIISDLGLISLCREVAPELAIHVSTQANTLNSRTVQLYKSMGAKRIVLARELSLSEAKAMHDACPDIEFEAFCHGAMCVSYSGRCLMSSYFTGRSANRGECVQPCRWSYKLVEEQRPDEPLSIEEDARGTYILNSKDMRLLSRIPSLAEAGICSLKVEGRMKSEFYIATVASAYREAIDEYLSLGYISREAALNAKLERVSHRPYTEGFLFGAPLDSISYDSTRTREKEIYVATVLSYSEGIATVEMRNRFKTGDTINILSPSPADGKRFVLGEISDPADGSVTDDAKLVQHIYSFACPYPLLEGDLLTRDAE